MLGGDPQFFALQLSFLNKLQQTQSIDLPVCLPLKVLVTKLPAVRLI
jgi:hypothetical protein